MNRPDRSDALWYAFVLHRISGLLLALFLPLHFYLLSQALTQPQRFAQFISWTDNPLVKIAETGLVFLLAVHLAGGLRLLALEFLPWSARQKSYAAAALGVSCMIAGLFLLSAI